VAIVDKLKRMSPAWYGAAAGAAVAGATLFPDARLFSGLFGAGAVLALGLYVTPCCDSCADAAAATDTSHASSQDAPAPAASSAPCQGCGQGADAPAPPAMLTAPTTTTSSTALATATAAKAEMFDGGAFLARFAR
jgi:hypothetical protein